MEKITVIFVLRTPWGGGAERVVFDIATGLDKNRFIPKIICLYRGRMVPKGIDAGITYLLLTSFFSERIQDLLGRSLWSWRALGSRVSALLRTTPLGRHILSALYRIINLTSNLNAARREKRLRACLLEKIGKALRFEFAGAAARPALRPVDDHQQARQLADFVNSIPGPLVIVPVMEEAASIVRLAVKGRLWPGRKPYIMSTHAWESYYLPVMFGNGYDIERERLLFAEACQGAEAVLSPCDGCRDDLIQHFSSPPERTMTMPNPVDIAVIQQAMLLPPEKKPPPSLKGVPFFVAVGRFAPEKRHDRILQACALLLRETDAFRMAFIGDGLLRHAVKEEIARLHLEHNVILLGALSNPFPYMRLATGLVCASYTESFGLALVEALACGCVPISVDCPYAPRYILDGGQAGFLTPNTPEGLAEAMLSVLHFPDMARVKVAHGQEHIRQFERQAVVQKWESLLTRAADARQA